MYGNSFESCLVAVVVPNKEVLTAWAKDAGVSGSYEELVKQPKAAAHVLAVSPPGSWAVGRCGVRGYKFGHSAAPLSGTAPAADGQAVEGGVLREARSGVATHAVREAGAGRRPRGAVRRRLLLLAQAKLSWAWLAWLPARP